MAKRDNKTLQEACQEISEVAADLWCNIQVDALAEWKQLVAIYLGVVIVVCGISQWLG